MASRADSGLVRAVRERIAAAGDPAKAPAVQAYMTSELPYHGVPSPGCRTIFREVLSEHPLPDRSAWLATVLELWDAATHPVGPLLLDHPAAVRPVLVARATDDDRWLRRTSVIAQVGAKEATDLDLLALAVEADLDDRDCFLRKAIGWALRQHARTDPAWVRSFVTANDDRISGLSRREPLEHVGAT